MTLQLLLGGTLFAAVYSAFDWLGVGITACVLVALELIHDVRLYRRSTNG
jgi:hypothetical protein